ncbi:HAMP domain-containing sensor histidine kinase [Pilimelia columellifera subsp. columellifera]|uniref:histidine kinase n=1 Tax=Pilimelia columellifera subsp. columellifera TaxID=706583 RepID=A0ABN3N2Q1_9ACTN
MLVAAAMTLTLLAFLAPLALLVRSVAEDTAVDRAARDAQTLALLVATGDRDAVALAAERMNAAGSFTVYLADGTTLGAPAPATDAVRFARSGRSLTVASDSGREIVLAVQGEGVAVVRAQVPEADLRRGVSRAWLMLAGLGALLLGLGVVVADRLAVSLVRPMGEVSAASRQLAAGQLDVRAAVAGPPEVREAAAALNHLAGRIQELLQQERENVADLSHRLRTPLTALRLEAETLPDPHAGRVAARIDGLERTVSALIRQARQRVAEPSGCDIAAVVAQRVTFWSALAEDTDRAMTSQLDDGPLPAAVPADELAAAVDALLGNVFAHTPDGVSFSVGLTRSGDVARLVVADEGGGLPGLTGRGISGGGSTGLGLDIASRLAASGGGSLRAGARSDGRPGTEVVLDLALVRPVLTSA